VDSRAFTVSTGSFLVPPPHSVFSSDGLSSPKTGRTNQEPFLRIWLVFTAPFLISPFPGDFLVSHSFFPPPRPVPATATFTHVVNLSLKRRSPAASHLCYSLHGRFFSFDPSFPFDSLVFTSPGPDFIFPLVPFPLTVPPPPAGDSHSFFPTILSFRFRFRHVPLFFDTDEHLPSAFPFLFAGGLRAFGFFFSHTSFPKALQGPERPPLACTFFVFLLPHLCFESPRFPWYLF